MLRYLKQTVCTPVWVRFVDCITSALIGALLMWLLP